MNLNYKKAAEIFAGIPNVELAFLFGSVAKGTARDTSDVDIAILLKKLPEAQKRLAFRSTTGAKLCDILNREVDIVMMNTAGSLLKYQIACHGMILFERKKGMAKKFRLNAIKEYFDYLPTFNFHYNRLKGKINGRRGLNKKAA